MIGVTLLILAIFNGFAGYSLLDDQLSGTGLRIAYSIALSIPVAGTWLASLLFGGEFPGPDIISRLYVIHILLLPALIAVLLGVHLALVVRHKHTQFAGPGRRGGQRRRRAAVADATPSRRSACSSSPPRCCPPSAALAQINPIWLYGPFDPAEVSARPSQPDWYMGWLDGALRLMPGWEIRAFGFEIPNPFFPAVLLAGLTFGLLYAWPFLEARFTGDRDRAPPARPAPRPAGAHRARAWRRSPSTPCCSLGGVDDVLATTFGLSVNAVLRRRSACWPRRAADRRAASPTGCAASCRPRRAAGSSRRRSSPHPSRAPALRMSSAPLDRRSDRPADGLTAQPRDAGLADEAGDGETQDGGAGDSSHAAEEQRRWRPGTAPMPMANGQMLASGRYGSRPRRALRLGRRRACRRPASSPGRPPIDEGQRRRRGPAASCRRPRSCTNQ